MPNLDLFKLSPLAKSIVENYYTETVSFKGFSLAGAKDGPGITVYKDKSEKYRGLYDNGKRHGPGEVMYIDGTTFKGFYKEGAWNG